MMDYRQLAYDCINWIQNWFSDKGQETGVVIGMSGGKDSTIVAALCAEALGKDKVIGVALPAENQSINEADEICAYFGIRYMCVPIGGIESAFQAQSKLLPEGRFSLQSSQNIPPRIRMTMLYAIAQSSGAMVANTCNLSEDYIGYATLYGDASGAFSPLGGLCVQEIIGIGKALGIPDKWVCKTPDDGLPHSCPDEEKFGFTYEVLDRYIREGICDDQSVKEKIDTMHRRNLFKTEILNIPKFIPHIQ